MSNLTVFNLKLDRETLKRLTDQSKDSKALIVKDENNQVTLDLSDQRIKIEQSKRGSEMAVFYQRDNPASNQLQLVGIPTLNTFARASKKTTTVEKVAAVKTQNKESPAATTTVKPKKKSTSSSKNSPYVRPPPSPINKVDPTIDLPLEERMMQLLALCPHSINALSKKLNCSTLDVTQKIKKVGLPLKDVGSSTKFILKPKFYAQIKIWDWPLYNSNDKREVARNVEEGYALLRLPPDAPERQNLLSPQQQKKLASSSQPLPGKAERKLATTTKKKRSDTMSPSHTPNSNISQSRATPPTYNTTTTTPTTTPNTSISSNNYNSNNNNIHTHSNNNNNNTSSSSSTITGTSRISTSTTTKGKGKIGHVLSPVASVNNHHTITANNNNNSSSINVNTTTNSNKSHTLKPPSTANTTPIARASLNSPTITNHLPHSGSAPPMTNAHTPVRAPRSRSPNIFYKPKVSSTDKKRKKSMNEEDKSDVAKKRSKLSYKRADIHNQSEFDQLCKEYQQKHHHYLKDLEQFRNENPIYLKTLENVPPHKSNREYAQRLRQSYDKDDFQKMLQKTQLFFATKNYVDNMWDNILEFADIYKINTL